MSSLSDHYYHILNNPFIAAPVIGRFYKEIHGVDQNLLLAQLVLPLCFHHHFQSKISNAIFGSKRRSSIWSIFESREDLYDLQERVDESKEITFLSLQHALNNDWIEFDRDGLSISKGVVSPPENIAACPLRAANKLGRLFSDYSTVEIYSHLGVQPQ